MAALIEKMERHHPGQKDAMTSLRESGSANRHDLEQAPANGIDFVESRDVPATDGG
jgi:hypothetical protein